MRQKWLMRRRGARRYRCPQSIKPETCEEILQSVWDITWSSQEQDVPPTAYIDFWEQCVQDVDDPDLMLDERSTVRQLVRFTRKNLSDTPQQLCDNIQAQYPIWSSSQVVIDDDQAWEALRFSVKLWAHIETTDASVWRSSGQTLAELITTSMPKPSTAHNSHRLDRNFSAHQLSKAGGLQLRWTDNICDHLKLSEGTVLVFRHSSWLANLEHSPKDDPFPPGFVSETLRTLCLLFRPLEQRRFRSHERYKNKHHHVDLELAITEHFSFDLQSYPYWQQQLHKIQLSYNSTQPSSISQYWYDRRNEVQWATLWMGALVVFLTVVTVIFGIIQCVTAIVQVYAIYHVPG